MFPHFISASCGEEICGMCWNEGVQGEPATHKVGEELPNYIHVPDNLSQTERMMIADRHNLTAYVCCHHFGKILGPVAREMCENPAIDMRKGIKKT